MKPHKLAYASFSVSDDDLVPQEWTDYFGLVPDIAITKGDPIHDPTGQDRKLTRGTGVWGISSKTAVYSDELADHLRYLTRVLGLADMDASAFAAHSGAHMRFFCYWNNCGGTREPLIPDDIREIAERSGIEIEIDEYS